MSPEAQRIAIAEACGWVNQGKAKGVPALAHRWRRPGTQADFTELPDYLNDLNAMHEAENVFYPSKENSERYAEFLLDVLEVPHAFVGSARCAFLTNHATAAQRAEAFLRTIGKWQP